MANDTGTAMRAAIARFLPSVVRLALKGGINGRQFGDLVRQAYVDVVTADYGRSGRPTNIARTALITGLSRNNVKRIRDGHGESNPTVKSDKKRYGLSTLLREWHTNTDYLDRDGSPLALPFDDADPSFSRLARGFFSDVPATTTLRELVDAGAVARTGEGTVVALRDYMLPSVGDVQNIERAGGLIVDFLGTVSHNLQRKPNERSRIEIRTTEEDIAVRHEAQFHQILDEEATKFYQRIDRWLLDHKQETSDDEPRTRLGFGVYQISGGGGDNSPT